MNLQNKVAVITGGASGLGAGTARVLAAAGVKVALFDLQIEKAQALAEELGGIAIACDVSNAENAQAAFNAVEESLGTCAIAVNCAGIGFPKRMLGKDGPMPLDFFEKMLQVNLIGTFNIMRLAAEQMSRNDANEDGERGVIINTASIAAFEGQIGQVAYSASKGGVVGMTLPAAREMGQFGVRVNTIAPGLFLTPMMEALPQEVQDALAQGLPFPKRLGQPEEFGNMVKFIAQSAVMNGETIRMDSAVRLQPK